MTSDPPAGRRSPLLDLRGLRTWFFTSAGVVKAVDGVDLTVGPGEVLVAVEAAGVHFADLLARQGLYPDGPPPPAGGGYGVAGPGAAGGRGRGGGGGRRGHGRAAPEPTISSRAARTSSP